MKILVEACLGLGDLIEATPLCLALHLLGHDVDLYLNTPKPEQLVPLFMGWSVLGRVHVRGDDIDYAVYDLGVSTRGRPSIQNRFPMGLCYCTHLAEVKCQSLWVTEANFQSARLLGYEGPIPAGHVQKSSRRFNLPEGTVVVHAGCSTRSPQKRWNHWPEVCARLQSIGQPVVVVGTEEDHSEDNWEIPFHPQFDLSLPDLAALLDQATFFLGNDSGVGHIATAVGLPGLLLFGPSNREIFRPNSKVMRTLAATPLQEQPKPLMPPDINLLPINRVWNEIEELLKDPRRDLPRELPMRPDQPLPVAVCRQMTGDAPDRANAAQTLEHIFSMSAGRLMRGHHRQTVVERAKRRAGNAHISRSYQLLKRLPVPSGHLHNSESSRIRYHARCGIRAGYSMRGYALLIAIWIFKRTAFLRSCFDIGTNWLMSSQTIPLRTKR